MCITLALWDAYTCVPCAHTFVLLNCSLRTSAGSWWQVPQCRALASAGCLYCLRRTNGIANHTGRGGLERWKVMTSTWPDSQDSSASQTGRQLLDSLHSAEAGTPDTAGEALGVQSKHRHRLSSSADQVREFWLALFVTEAINRVPCPPP